MPLTFNDIMSELPIIRQKIEGFLTDYILTSLEISWLEGGPDVRCYYYPKRDKKAVALCGFVFIPKAYEADTWKPALIFSVYIYEDYGLYFRGDEELFSVLKPFFINYKDTILSKYDGQYKAQQFMKACKRELMEAAWHPRRIEAWLNAGADLDGI
jgi:hypothetical protein